MNEFYCHVVESPLLIGGKITASKGKVYVLDLPMFPYILEFHSHYCVIFNQFLLIVFHITQCTIDQNTQQTGYSVYHWFICYRSSVCGPWIQVIMV